MTALDEFEQLEAKLLRDEASEEEKLRYEVVRKECGILTIGEEADRRLREVLDKGLERDLKAAKERITALVRSGDEMASLLTKSGYGYWLDDWRWDAHQEDCCPGCQGSGDHLSSFGEGLETCERCGGSGWKPGTPDRGF
jgi:hypothetical protein